MLTDLRIVLPNRPGAVTQLCEALGAAGINIEGICGDLRPGERWGYIHIAVEDPDKATTLIEGAGYEITASRRVDLVTIEDKPGEFARVLREYSANDRNIDVVYVASNNRLVISTDEMLDRRVGVNIQDART